MMKGTSGNFVIVAAETRTLEDHLILIVLHMMEAAGPTGMNPLKETEPGEIGMNPLGMMIDILGGNFALIQYTLVFLLDFSQIS